MSMIEVLVSLGLLAVVLTLATQLLFSTQRASQRQATNLEARQTARIVADYTNFMLRGATDRNSLNGNALAIMVWMQKGTDPAYQTTYNNLTAAEQALGYGDEGTDLITFARADSSNVANLRHWNGFQSAATAYWEFGLGCPDSAENFRMFQDLTGAHQDPNNPNRTIGDPILLIDASGNYGLYQITDYKEQPNADTCGAVSVPAPDPDCPAGLGCVGIVANPGQSDMLNPPGGQTNLVRPVQMMLGVRFFSLRIKNGWLEQKSGMFDPADPDAGFTRLVPDVEDFQIAWIYTDGTIWNNRPNHQLSTSGACTNCDTNVPSQGSTDVYDIRNVIGVRITVTVRSSQPVPGDRAGRYREAAEDRPEATSHDAFYHYQLTTTAMLRNRALGS